MWNNYRYLMYKEIKKKTYVYLVFNYILITGITLKNSLQLLD